MTGQEFKTWVIDNQIKVEAIALELGVSSAAVFKWYRMKTIPLRTILALQMVGYQIEEDPNEKRKDDKFEKEPDTQRKKMR